MACSESLSGTDEEAACIAKAVAEEFELYKAELARHKAAA